MMTFFEAWPPFHICAVQDFFVCFNYYGRPPVVILHFGDTFKIPLLVCCVALKRLELGEVSFELISVRLGSGLVDCCSSFEALGAQTICTYKTAQINLSQCSVCSQHTVVLSKLRFLTHRVPSCFSRLYTHCRSHCFRNISWLFYSLLTKCYPSLKTASCQMKKKT